MNHHENTESETLWERITEAVFYEPRTIPAGWDLSEYLPASSQMAKGAHIEFSEDQSNS